MIFSLHITLGAELKPDVFSAPGVIAILEFDVHESVAANHSRWVDCMHACLHQVPSANPDSLFVSNGESYINWERPESFETLLCDGQRSAVVELAAACEEQSRLAHLIFVSGVVAHQSQDVPQFVQAVKMRFSQEKTSHWQASLVAKSRSRGIIL